MKYIFYLSLFLCLTSCKEGSREAEGKIDSLNTNPDTISSQATKGSIDDKPVPGKYHTNLDSVMITTENSDTLIYSNAEFNEIVDYFPSFYNEYWADPDLKYYSDRNNKRFMLFNSEAGQDNYYILYAYFLKKKTGGKKFADRRKNLITIFQDINSIYGMLNYGGTYFGHQHTRILGYAEYSIYRFIKRDSAENAFDLKKQKELYIESLRQIIRDKESINQEANDKEKSERIKNLNKIVDEISNRITDYFYLEEARSFQFGHYK